MYRAPLKDVFFILNELIGEKALAAVAGHTEYSSDLADSVLGEAARFSEGVLDPLNRTGDKEGVKWTPEGVTTAKGFKQAYRQFIEGGWPQLTADPEYGGQGAPQILATAVQEFFGSANLAFKLCPMLTFGAIEAIQLTGTNDQKKRYLPKMVSGEWTGTMCLTEPQAGSDLAAIRTRAAPEGDHYRLSGQKIFITFGEHDYTENIIHMVLGRIDGSPPGVKGISLFIVPKVLVNADGSLGKRNDVHCNSVEHKLGIHASPTCVMAFGEKGGAEAYLLGEANRGLEYMFIMMNAARLAVGLEGYAIAERAFQHASEWARTRVQGKPPGANVTNGPATIIHHPDVKRMLLEMKAGVEGMRALGLYTAHHIDVGRHHADAKVREAGQVRADLLIPIVKGWSTEFAIELASLGVQIHGGMGFIEETGAAQYYRDVRITAIYEGTTAIQANDLIGRKIGRDRGAGMSAFIADMRKDLQAIQSPDPATITTKRAAFEAIDSLSEATESLLAAIAKAPECALAVSVPYLQLCGFVAGGWLMAKSSGLAAGKLSGADKDFYAAKVSTARFYADHLLPRVLSLTRVVKAGATSVLETDAALI